MRLIKNFLQGEEGPTAVEYAVMLAMIAGVCIASVSAMSNATASSFTDSAGQLASAFGS